MLEMNVQHSLGTLVKLDDSATEPGKKTFDYLLASHFSSITEIKPTEITELKLQTCEIMSQELNWITPEKIIHVLNQFKSKNSPGPDGLKPIVLKHLL